LTLRGGPRLSLRTYSSDPDVFRQVFIEAQYELPIRLSGVTRVIDAGANVGLSTLYFLLRYPEATVVALEPEESNHELCAANTRAFGERCRVLRAALWSHPTSLSVIASDAAWSTRVLEVGEGHPSVEAMSLVQVLERTGWEAVDIVKLDIEGAEENVLAAETPDTVARGRCWAVEIHTDGARRSFERLFGDSRWRTGQQGEIDFAWRTN
jgi:FkbM family methyltransferase